MLDELDPTTTGLPRPTPEETQAFVQLFHVPLSAFRASGDDGDVFRVVPALLRSFFERQDGLPEHDCSAVDPEFAGYLKAFVYYLVAVARIPDAAPWCVDDADWALAEAGVTRAQLLPEGAPLPATRARIEALVGELLARCEADAAREGSYDVSYRVGRRPRWRRRPRRARDAERAR